MEENKTNIKGEEIDNLRIEVKKYMVGLNDWMKYFNTNLTSIQDKVVQIDEYLENFKYEFEDDSYLVRRTYDELNKIKEDITLLKTLLTNIMLDLQVKKIGKFKRTLRPTEKVR